MIGKASFQRRLTSNKLGKVTISKPVLIAACASRSSATLFGPFSRTRRDRAQRSLGTTFRAHPVDVDSNSVMVVYLEFKTLTRIDCSCFDEAEGAIPFIFSVKRSLAPWSYANVATENTVDLLS
jgi:hypothetical protein